MIRNPSIFLEFSPEADGPLQKPAKRCMIKPKAVYCFNVFFQGENSMKFLIASAVALSTLAAASAAHAQSQGRMFFECDVICGDPAGAPLSPRVLDKRFH